MQRLWTTLLAGAALAVLPLVSANATLTLTSGLVGGSGDVDNVIFNACGLSSGPALTVQGCLNTSHSTLVNFTGTENLLIPSGGQARVEAQDGAFDNVLIKLDSPLQGFSKLQFNIDAIADGFASFEAIDQFGTHFAFDNIALTGNGQNFWGLYGDAGEQITSITWGPYFPSGNGVDSIRQVRVGGVQSDLVINPLGGVPEPATWAMLLIGFGAIGATLRTRKSSGMRLRTA